MASGRVATEPCPACGKDSRHRVGRLCTPCYSRLNVTLGSLPLLAGEAAGRLEPESRTAGVSGRSAPGSRPPVNVDALDPALALIELVQGDSSSRVTILEALESWERVVRAENKLAPYGVASSRHRDPLSTTATLGHVCRFLSVWLEWMSNDEHLDIADFRGHVWAAFSSETYKNLPSVGTIEVTNPYSGTMESFTMPDGGNTWFYWEPAKAKRRK